MSQTISEYFSLNQPTFVERSCIFPKTIEKIQVNSETNSTYQSNFGENQFKNEEVYKNFDLIEGIENANEPSQIMAQKKIKKEKKKNLSDRNIKYNYFFGVRNFLEFKICMAQIKDDQMETIYQNLLIFMVTKKQQFRSCDGWKAALSDKTYGEDFKRICKKYFQNLLADIYILNSKVKKEYQTILIKRKKLFLRATQNINYMQPKCLRERKLKN